MRVAVDTNVFVSAFLKERSLPALAVQLVDRGCTLLKSDSTERQLLEVLARPYFVPLIPSASRLWLERLMGAAELVAIAESIVACRDSTDDKFLELAVNGRANFLVSGDADLLVLDPFRGIPILTPAAFVVAMVEGRAPQGG